MLTLENLVFRYPGEAEPWRFELEVSPGEIVGISGPSGSGKSTLLDLIAGFLAPEAGDIRLNGQSLVPLPPESRPVSILFQSDNLFEHLTAAANAALGLPEKGASSRPRDAEIREALKAVGLEEFGNRPAAKLSGGQNQRVALARTLLRDRPVLLLDEPFAALDEATAAGMRDHVGGLVRARDWHAIMVSHIDRDLSGLADRTLMLTDRRFHPA